MCEVFLYLWEIESMPIYTNTIPTAHTPGKVWRARDACFMFMFGHPYQCGDKTYSPVITHKIQVRYGPQPMNYKPPDWSNSGQYCAPKFNRVLRGLNSGD